MKRGWKGNEVRVGDAREREGQDREGKGRK